MADARRGALVVAACVLAAAGGATAVAVVQSSDPAPSGPRETASPSAPAAVPWVASPVPKEGVSLTPALSGETTRVSLIADETAAGGSRYPFVVRLYNASNEPVSLANCPPYRVQMAKVVETGLLNCESAPKSIRPYFYVDFAMEVAVNPAAGTPQQLLWQLGSEGDEGPTATTDIPVDL
jgi:hypothetical protein